MGGVVFLEILDGRGRVTDRVRITALPATIGRSYGSDVILDDRRVCPAHARLSQADDGSYQLEDLDSVNGLYALGGTGPVQRLSLTPGTRFRIGRSTVRFCTEEQSVAPTIPEAARDGRVLRGMLEPRWAGSAVLVALIGFAVYEYLTNSEKVVAGDLLAVGVGILVLLALWAGLWAVGTRLVSHRFRFLSHLGWAASLSLVAIVVSMLEEYLDFVFPSNTLVTVIGAATGILIAGVWLYGHLTLASSLSRNRRRGIAWGIAIGTGGLVWLLALGQDSFSSEVEYSGTLRPYPVS
ncbi:MAG: FHA domain-containing protein, partial [Gemmatimonadales bacterium]|nr:FHA domain-containing protein [Gemmatimonadales bacterium]